jgi:hypothetical protein
MFELLGFVLIVILYVTDNRIKWIPLSSKSMTWIGGTTDYKLYYHISGLNDLFYCYTVNRLTDERLLIATENSMSKAKRACFFKELSRAWKLR